VEVHDVLADEVHHVAVRVRSPEFLDAPAVVLAPLVGAGEVAHGSVHPDVEVLVLLSGNLEPEVRRVPRDVPVAQRLGKPGVDGVLDLGLQPSGGPRPLAEEVLVFRQLHEVVHRAAQLEVRVPQIAQRGALERGRLVRASAVLAGVAVLVLGPAHRALAPDEPVGQETLVHAAIDLEDVPLVDRAVRAQHLEDAPGVLLVLRRMRV